MVIDKHDVDFTKEDISFIENMTYCDEEKRRLLDRKMSPDATHETGEPEVKEYDINSVDSLLKNYCNTCKKVRKYIKKTLRRLW